MGDELLQDVTTIQVQRLVNKMQDEKASSRNRAYVITVLRSAFQKAVDVDVLSKNVVASVEKPQITTKEHNNISYNERFSFMDACFNERYGVAYVLMLFTGIHKGECLGLRWLDVDFDENFIHIKQSLGRIRKIDAKGNEVKSEILIGSPKTKNSIRSIAVPQFVMDKLSVYKAKVEAEKEKAGIGYVDSGLVFCTEVGGHIEPRNFYRKFKQILDNAEITSVTVHELRHPYVKHTLNKKLLQYDYIKTGTHSQPQRVPVLFYSECFVACSNLRRFAQAMPLLIF